MANEAEIAKGEHGIKEADNQQSLTKQRQL
jgi:hypothetical protein